MTLFGEIFVLFIASNFSEQFLLRTKISDNNTANTSLARVLSDVLEGDFHGHNATKLPLT